MNISPDKSGWIQEHCNGLVACYHWASDRKSIRICGYEFTITEEQYEKIKPLFPAFYCEQVRRKMEGENP